MGILTQLASAAGFLSESVELARAVPAITHLNDPDCADDTATSYRIAGGSGMGDYTTHYDNVSVCDVGIARNVQIEQSSTGDAILSFDVHGDWTDSALDAVADAVKAAHAA